MINPITAANIFSKLGSNSSLLPMMVKDTAHSAGMTTSSYLAGKEVEGKDRFIDEIGAEIIWIGGIPFFKKVIDVGIKTAGYDPKIDIRLLKDKKLLQKAIENAPTEGIKQNILKAVNKEKSFKGLFLAKFIASTALTLSSYWGLTIVRHKHTEKNLIEQIKKEEAEKKAKALVFKGHQNKNLLNTSKPSFGMKLSGLKEFMFNPVKNMMIVDGGITAERLGESRNPQDFMGYVIKEGAFWGFMYFAGEKIQNFFEKKAEKIHNKSIDMDIKILQDGEFKNAFANGKLVESLKEIGKLKNKEELYDFICNNSDNLVVKMAKQAGLINEYKGSGKVDTRLFIDLDAINGGEKESGLVQKLEKLLEQFKKSNTESQETLDCFFKKTISLKRASILKNIGTCMGVLGVVVPGIMLSMRLLKKGNKEFAVKKELHEKLKKENFA